MASEEEQRVEEQVQEEAAAEAEASTEQAAAPSDGAPQEASSTETASTEEQSGAHTAGESKSSAEGSSDSTNSVRPSNYKTRMCMKWQQSGECSFGNRCNFAHGQHEIRNQQHNEAPPPANQQASQPAANYNTSSNSTTTANNNNNNTNSSRDSKSTSAQANRKTRLCMRWREYGECPYRDKCNFAHGVHELRQTADHLAQMQNNAAGANKSNYKTRICLNWQHNGQCTYGSRCNFAHGQQELRQHAKDKGGNANNSNFQNMGMAGYGMMPVAQMPFPAMGGDMQFQSPVVPMDVRGNMMMGMAGMSLENFGQPGFVPQMPPMFPTGPLQVPPMMVNMMQRMHPPVAPMGPPGGVMELQAEANPMVPDPAQ